jgi:predicted phage terminase large subunit-like protein
MTTRREFLDSIGRLAAGFRQKIEAEVDGFAADAATSAQRRARAMADLEFFARAYFPHYVKRPNSRLHDHLYARLPALADAPDSQADAIAAPRGEAKSTLTSQIFVLWCVLTGRKHYAMIGMGAFDQAAIMLEAIKAELEFNPRLALDFPEATGPGRVWNAGVIVTQNNAKIEAVGSGKRIRGRRHGPHRPDLFVGDDLENDENVKTPEQRDKLQAWLTQAVLKLGGAGEKFDVVIIGTILHYDSVLARLLHNPLWMGAKFKALIRWPDRMDLWDAWEGLLREAGPETARAYYQARQADMERGAEVSWPAGRPLYELMLIRARDGRASFDSELQNDPVAGDNAPFAAVLDGPDCWWHTLPAGLVYYGAVDPSLGRQGASRDPSALLVGGLHRATGTLYVVEARIAKRLPDRIIEDVIALHARYRCAVWAVEAVQFQEFLRTELIKRSAVRGIPVPARAVKPVADKLLRIETLQPHLANGLIRLHPSQTTLIEQLRHFPKADHDDGPDALHMLWMAATTGYAGLAHQSAGARQTVGAADRLTATGWGTVAGGNDMDGY